jgi:hypothetical protein
MARYSNGYLPEVAGEGQHADFHLKIPRQELVGSRGLRQRKLRLLRGRQPTTVIPIQVSIYNAVETVIFEGKPKAADHDNRDEAVMIHSFEVEFS